MKITKYLHSCLMVEDQDKTILIDPGIFTYEAGILDFHSLSKLDSILITHEHADHVHLPFLLEIIDKFPHATIVSNESVVKLLSQHHITATTKPPEGIIIEEVPHESVWDNKPPQNILFHIFNTLTDSGDSLHFLKTQAILALPITAP